MCPQILFDPTSTKKKKKKKKPFMLDEDGDGHGEESQQVEPSEVEPEAGEEREMDPEDDDVKISGERDDASLIISCHFILMLFSCTVAMDLVMFLNKCI